MARARIVAATVAVGLVLAACGAPTDADGGQAGGSAEPAPAATDLAALDVERPAPDSPDVEQLAAGLNDVGYRLFAAAAGDSSDDLVLSPLSIGIAFGMADAGASGATADALADLFAYPVEGEARWLAFNALEQDVTDVGGPVVRLANRQFPDTGFATVDGYDERLATYFGARVEPLPLKAESEPSRVRINDWVAEQTEDLISDLLPDGFLNAQSVLVLVNALYLEADWASPFGKYPTEDADFTRLDGSTVTVPLMHELELNGPAVATDTYAATEIPYEGNELSMLVVVPAEGSYAEIEARLGDGLVDEIDAAGEAQAVELFLPRFESESNLDLRALIEGHLGAAGIFGVAGYDGIAPGITLESAVHAADIAVDEQGTVAAAATALGFEESGPPEPEVTVRADRPFLYLIRHQPTGVVLFVGRVLDPSA
ncbi:MAG TPA: serpin family protein [Egicoccus sp.]|nr:serpin family protein [Egicoccus sp.]HSK21619.1 serpin family protein [Egicoccus sp.]